MERIKFEAITLGDTGIDKVLGLQSVIFPSVDGLPAPQGGLGFSFFLLDLHRSTARTFALFFWLSRERETICWSHPFMISFTVEKILRTTSHPPASLFFTPYFFLKSPEV